jgi:SAM-dependent methyltransferase
MSPATQTPVAGNIFDKYHSSNPLHRQMMRGFIHCANELLEMAGPKRVLEVGAGPGDLAYHLFGKERGVGIRDVSYCGIDISEEQVNIARQRYPALSFRQASVYDLPFEDGAFDMCLACEVFEHLEEPHAALSEVARVSREYLLVSVPWEPVWRALNVLRGRYLTSLGNTPGHVQHFSRREIRELVRGRFDVVAERRPLPWTMILAKHPTPPRRPKKPR